MTVLTSDARPAEPTVDDVLDVIRDLLARRLNVLAHAAPTSDYVHGFYVGRRSAFRAVLDDLPVAVDVAAVQARIRAHSTEVTLREVDP